MDRFIDIKTGSYPLSRDDAVRRMPETAFGGQLSEDDMAALGVARVLETERPIESEAIQSIEEGAPQFVDGAWRQTWTVTARPAPPEVFAAISDRQFFQALALPRYAIITTQEALDAVKTGEIPQVMQAVVDSLPADQQFAATMLIAGATLYERTNPLVEIFGASQGMDAAAINAFWHFAEAL